MSTYKPLYYVRASKPRSLDANEIAALVPAAGAPHTQAFRIASKEVGRAVRINGTTSVYLIRNPISTWPTVNLTFECWARFDVGTSFASSRSMLNYAQAGNDNEIGFGISTTRRLYLIINNVSLTDSVDRADDGLYHHYAATWRSSDGQAIIYVDGVQVTSGTIKTGYSIVGGGSLIIGQDQDSVGGSLDAAQAWIGELDEMRIYARILGAQEIAQHAAEMYQDETSACGRWGFDQIDDAPIGRDDSGAGNHVEPVGITGGTQDTILHYLPYLDGESLRGRRGRIDLTTRRTDVGEITFSLIDKRLNTTEQLTRWFTAFTGNVDGSPLLPGCKFHVSESLDNGATRSAYFTGRASAVSVRKAVASVSLQDAVTEIDSDVFVSTPSASLSYVSRPALLPLGYNQAIFHPTRPMQGTINQVDATNKQIEIVVNMSDYRNQNDNYVSKAFVEQMTRLVQPSDALQRTSAVDYMRVHVKKQSGSPEGEFLLYSAADPSRQPFGKDHTKLGWMAMLENPITSDSKYVAATAFSVSDQVFFWIIPGKAQRVTKSFPIFIDNVHPVQLWKDLLDGKFGYLSANDTPTRTYPYDATAFDALIADTRFGLARFIITDTEKIADFIEKQLCLPFNLTYRIDNLGRVVPVDMRPPDAAVSVTTITDADLSQEELPEWSIDRSSAITRIVFKWFSDIATSVPTAYADVAKTIVTSGNEIIDLPPGLLSSSENELMVLDFGNTDLPDNTLEIEAKGYRAGPSPYEIAGATLADLQFKAVWIERTLLNIANAFRSVFSRGKVELTLKCRRTANTDRLPGQFVLLDIDVLPDPNSNLRGGVRLVRVVERTEDGPRRILRVVDSGQNVVANAPVIGTITTETGNTRHGVVVPITVNAQVDPVIVQYAVTTTGVGTAPTDTDGRWTTGQRLTASGNANIRDLLSGKRIWIRARSEPAAMDQFRIASPWVYATSPASVDLGSLTVPSGVSVTNIKDKSVHVTWTVGEADEDVVVYLASPSGGTLEFIRRLPPGSSAYDLIGLVPSTSYRVEIGHQDAYGSESTRAGANFSTNSTVITPDAPRIAIYQGRP